ncbi:MAG TPA: hypothetical protein VM554_10375 [Acidisarcina sp.]|nr:hypothetical protein [Acidisarcina sp.]
MSTATTQGCAVNASAPITRRIRAYFAPVDRTLPAPVPFDAAQFGRFDLENPPAPWIDLGWVDNFSRKSASEIGSLAAGAPGASKVQVRQKIDASVSLRFLHWGKLQMALAAGSDHWNLLTPPGTNAVSLVAGSTATTLMMSSTDAATFSVGQRVAVDVDYTGQTGYVGSGASCAYIRNATAVQGDVHYVRRLTLNVSRVAAVGAGSVQLEEPLLAGAPSAAMRVQTVAGFMDREGGTFFQEWSALFVMDGEEGERILYNYPRLQAMKGGQESTHPVAGTLERICLAAEFRAMPVVDIKDGQPALCYRSFLPAAGMPL